MPDPQILNTLRTKRAEIERVIAYHEERLKVARIDLAHVSAVMRLYEIETADNPQFPVHMDLSRLFKRGDIVAICKKALAAAAEPMTTRELTLAVIEAKGWDRDDPALKQAIAYRIVQALRLQWKRGAILSPGKKGNVRFWAVR